MMIDGVCEEFNECLTGDHDCDLNAKVTVRPTVYDSTYNFSVRMRSQVTAVSARKTFMVVVMTVIILIHVGINHAITETAHVTLSPI